MESNSKELKETQENMTEKIANVESKLDQLLELLSKSQNPDQLQN